MDLAGGIESVQIAVKNYSRPRVGGHFLAFEVVGKARVFRELQQTSFRIDFEPKVFEELRSQYGGDTLTGGAPS